MKRRTASSFSATITVRACARSPARMYLAPSRQDANKYRSGALTDSQLAALVALKASTLGV